jgi:Tol biopolymer transport system component
VNYIPSWSPDGTKIAFVREIRISDIEPGYISAKVSTIPEGYSNMRLIGRSVPQLRHEPIAY